MADTEITIIPALPGQKALIFYAFDDGDNPPYELTEHPVIAWRTEKTIPDDPLTTYVIPVLALSWSHGFVGVLYDDGRVIFDGSEYAHREAFESACWKMHEITKAPRT